MGVLYHNNLQGALNPIGIPGTLTPAEGPVGTTILNPAVLEFELAMKAAKNYAVAFTKHAHTNDEPCSRRQWQVIV